MKYASDEALAEVLRRGGRLALRRGRRRRRTLSGTAGALLCALAAVIAAQPGGGPWAAVSSVYGSLLLSAQAGGYVLAAVLAFALGVCVTLLCLRKRKQVTDQKKEESEP